MPLNKVVNGYEFVTYSVNQHFQLFFKEKNSKTYPLHYHNAMEITMPLSKPYGCTGDQSFAAAQANEILFIGSGVLHCVGPLKGQEGGSHYTLLVDVDWIHQFQAFDLLLKKTASIFILRTSMKNYPDARNCLFEIYRLYDSEDIYKDILIASQFLKFITLIAEEIDRAEAASQPQSVPASGDLRKTILFSSHYIKDHCTEDLTLESMGRMLGISKYHYHRKFQEICRMSFHEHLASCRMQIASDLLQTGNRPVEEIAHLCGYKSVPGFIRMFKLTFHTTPAQYRKHHRLLASC